MKHSSMFKKKILIEETRMSVISDIDFQKIELEEFIINQRNKLKEYIIDNPLFLKTLKPYESDNKNNNFNHKIIKKMIEGSNVANVGPTATLAGTIAELSLDYLIQNGSNYSILNNGGDIAFLNNYLNKKVIFGIYAGNSPLSGKIGFEFKNKSKNQKMGICTSSGSVGYSISYGRSDSVTVISQNSSIADGLATSIGNNVNGMSDQDAVENGVAAAEKFKKHFIGVLIIVGESVGIVGKIPRIVETNHRKILKKFKEK